MQKLAFLMLVILIILFITIMSANKPEIQAPLSPAEAKLLKEKMRQIEWSGDAVLREVVLIQKLRLFSPRDSGDCGGRGD